MRAKQQLIRLVGATDHCIVGSVPASETGLEPVTSGSLWPENGRGLFADFRAYRVGDLVTVRIDESSEAAGDSSTNFSAFSIKISPVISPSDVCETYS